MNSLIDKVALLWEVTANLCMFLLVAVKGQYITQYPAVIKSRVNETVTLNCQFVGMDSACYAVSCMKLHPKSGTLDFEHDVRVWKDVGKTSCKANISIVTPEDSGTYHCAVVVLQQLFIGNGTTIVVESMCFFFVSGSIT